MEVISQEQFDELPGKNKHSAILQALRQLDVYQALIIKPEEWKTKTKPNSFINQVFRLSRGSEKFTVKTIPGSGGWAVLRIK